jgi:hypothetical protein
VFDQAQTALPLANCTIGAPLPFAPACAVDAFGTAMIQRSGVTATFRQRSAVRGSLGAASTLSVSGATRASYQAATRSGYYDQYTVSSGAVLRFNIAVDGIGTLTGTDQSGAFSSLPYYGSFSVANYGTQDIPSTYAPSGPGVGVLSASNVFRAAANVGTQTGFVDVPLVGTVNNLLFTFVAVAALGRPLTVAEGAPWSASATADFLHTLEITGVSVLDAEGRDITANVQLSSASGTVVTPEPGTWALLATGLLVVGGIAARRKRAAL